MSTDELTLQEAANALGVAASTLRHQIRNDRLAAVKRGPIWFVPRSEVERYRRDSLGQAGRPVAVESRAATA